jgi:hypothetical protein
MLGHSIVSQHFMEPEGSVPNSQDSPPVPILSQTNPVHITPIPPLQDPFQCYPPTFVLVFLVVSFLLVFPPITYTRSSSPPFVLLARPSHPPRLDYSNYTWRRVQITKILVMKFSPFSRHLILLDRMVASYNMFNSYTERQTLCSCILQLFTL